MDDDDDAQLMERLAAAGDAALAAVALSQMQREMGVRPHLVVMAGLALADTPSAASSSFSQTQERRFARLQIFYQRARARLGVPGDTSLFKLSPMLVPAAQLSRGPSVKAPSPSADPPACENLGPSEASCAAAAAAAQDLLAELEAEAEAEAQERSQRNTGATVKRSRGKQPSAHRAAGRGTGGGGGGDGGGACGGACGGGGRASASMCDGGEGVCSSESHAGTLDELAAAPLRVLDEFVASEWTEVAGRRRQPHASPLPVPAQQPARPDHALGTEATCCPTTPNPTPALEIAAAEETVAAGAEVPTNATVAAGWDASQGMEQLRQAHAQELERLRGAHAAEIKSVEREVQRLVAHATKPSP